MSSLIVVWCTNAKAHQDQLINEIFPKWDVKYLTTWFWVKVSTMYYLVSFVEHIIFKFKVRIQIQIFLLIHKFSFLMAQK
jgi:hypothetical protein